MGAGNLAEVYPAELPAVEPAGLDVDLEESVKQRHAGVGGYDVEQGDCTDHMLGYSADLGETGHLAVGFDADTAADDQGIAAADLHNDCLVPVADRREAVEAGWSAAVAGHEEVGSGHSDKLRGAGQLAVAVSQADVGAAGLSRVAGRQEFANN